MGQLSAALEHLQGPAVQWQARPGQGFFIWWGAETLTQTPVAAQPQAQTRPSEAPQTGFHHSLKWQCRLLTSGCSLPPSSLQFHLSFSSLSLPSLYQILVHYNTCCGWAFGCLRYVSSPGKQEDFSRMHFNR